MGFMKVFCADFVCKNCLLRQEENFFFTLIFFSTEMSFGEDICHIAHQRFATESRSISNWALVAGPSMMSVLPKEKYM